MKNIINIETSFGKWFALVGVIIQLIVFYLTNDSVLALISGVAGVISVVLCSQRKISFYFWGFLQVGTFLIIAIDNNLFGKIVENIFYIITMIYGIFAWKHNSDKNGKVIPKKWGLETTFLLMLAVIVGGYMYVTFDVPKLNVLEIDIVTSILAIIAQILMVLGYREQWYFWFGVDVLCVILFASMNEWCMVVQYIFWTINCVYGYLNWRK